MTFILSAVRSSYRGLEKTFVIPKLRVNFVRGVIRSKVNSVGEWEIYLCVSEILYSACTIDAT